VGNISLSSTSDKGLKRTLDTLIMRQNLLLRLWGGCQHTSK
jgi:hypothetical protein